MIVLKTRRQKIERVAFAPDGRGLAAAGQQGAWWWKSVTTGGPAVRFGEVECRGIGFDPGGERLVTLSVPPGIRVVTLADQAEQVAPIPGLRWGGQVTVCPASGAVVLDQSFADGLSGWRFGSEGLALAWSAKPEPGSIGSVPAFGPDGVWFVRAANYGLPRAGQPFGLVFRAAATGEVIREVPARDWVQCGPAVSPDGRLVAYGSAHSVIAQRPDDPGWHARVANDNTRQFTGVTFHPSGRFLAATSNDTTVKLYDTGSWKLATTFTWEIGRLRSVAFSPDGTLAAVGSDTGKVVVWDVDL